MPGHTVEIGPLRQTTIAHSRDERRPGISSELQYRPFGVLAVADGNARVRDRRFYTLRVGATAVGRLDPYRCCLAHCISSWARSSIFTEAVMSSACARR